MKNPAVSLGELQSSLQLARAAKIKAHGENGRAQVAADRARERLAQAEATVQKATVALADGFRTVTG